MADINTQLAPDIFAQQVPEVMQAIINAIPGHVALLAPSGGIIAANEKWTRFCEAHQPPCPAVGLEMSDLASSACAGIFVVGDRTKAAIGIRRVASGASLEFSMEYPCDLPGEQRWFRMLVSPVPIEHQIAILVMHVDISARVAAAAQLGQQSAAIGQCNATQEHTYHVNTERAHQLIALQREVNELCARVAEPARYGFGEAAEQHAGTPNGRFASDNGYLSGETEVRRAANKAVSHEAQRPDPGGWSPDAVAHEFNNILAGALGNIELALAEVPENGVAWTSIHEIWKSLMRVSDMVGEVLALSLPTGHKDVSASSKNSAADLKFVHSVPLLDDVNILYIEDDSELLSILTRLLSRHGCNIVGFSDQQMALAALRVNVNHFDLVVTDYEMPIMSGIEIAQQVRLINADLPVAIVSGFIDEKLTRQAAESGVLEVISKANRSESICQALLRLIRNIDQGNV